MANPLNSTNLTLDEEDYNRLKQIKLLNGWTFNETLDKLCELEFQNNYIMKICEYSLVTEQESRLFRVTFKKDNMVVEYYHPDRGYKNKIGNCMRRFFFIEKFS